MHAGVIKTTRVQVPRGTGEKEKGRKNKRVVIVTGYRKGKREIKDLMEKKAKNKMTKLMPS